MKHLVNALFILLLAVPASAATLMVVQAGFAFTPDEITITVGDTVEWLWSGGGHTVTSGIDNADPNAGDFFDATLDGSNPFFSFEFDTVGDYPYFCRPHVGIGMDGIVHVQPSVPNEEATWGSVKSLFE